MPGRQQIVALIVSIALLVLIVELVRRRRLREEYSVLWILTAVGIFVLAVWYDLLVSLTHLIGAVLPTSTLFFFSLLFLVLLCLQFSVRISKLDEQVKELAQTLALRERRNRRVRKTGVKAASRALKNTVRPARRQSSAFGLLRRMRCEREART